MTYRILKLDADTNEWNVVLAGDDYAAMNRLVRHYERQTNEVYAVQNTITGEWV